MGIVEKINRVIVQAMKGWEIYMMFAISAFENGEFFKTIKCLHSKIDVLNRHSIRNLILDKHKRISIQITKALSSFCDRVSMIAHFWSSTD